MARKQCFLVCPPSGNMAKKHCFMFCPPLEEMAGKQCFLICPRLGSMARKHCFVVCRPTGNIVSAWFSIVSPRPYILMTSLLQFPYKHVFLTRSIENRGLSCCVEYTDISVFQTLYLVMFFCIVLFCEICRYECGIFSTVRNLYMTFIL